MNSSRKTACSMPDTGPCAPARTLVAVRAMVPVTQKPPNSAEAALPTPCATSSQLERWRRPVMPSATTAESSDSIAPSSVKDKAAGSTSRIFAKLNTGKDGNGSAWGMPPKRVPMVATDKSNAAVMAAALATAISMPGQCGLMDLRPMMIAATPTESATAVGETDPSEAHNTGSFSSSGPGSALASVRPRSSLIWLAKMMTAMPAVKPTVTGKGMNLI